MLPTLHDKDWFISTENMFHGEIIRIDKNYSRYCVNCYYMIGVRSIHHDNV